MSKAGEIAYLKRIGEAGSAHAAAKPFSDPNCAGYLAELAAVMALLPDLPATVLDLGCGTGWTSRFLAKRGYHVTGIDIAEDMIAVAEAQRAAEGVEALRFLACDYETLGIAGEYDAAVFFDALHHSEDERAAIRAAFGALKPGGVCVVSEPGKGHARSPDAVSAREKYGVTERDMPPARVIAAGKAAGFRAFAVHPHAMGIHKTLFAKPAGIGLRRLLRFGIVRALATAAVALWRKHASGIVVMTK